MSNSEVRMDIDFCNILIKKRSLRFDYKEAKVKKECILLLINLIFYSVPLYIFLFLERSKPD